MASPRWPRLALAAAVAALASCAPAAFPPEPASPQPTADVRLVLTERWSGGGRLVVVDDAGDRRAVLVAPPPGAPATVRDEQAAFSPDGRWIVFASTRGRDLGRTALWLVPARAGAEPVRLTDGPTSDVSPVFTPDGRAVVFASDRAGTFDLYRLDLAADLDRPGPRAPGRPRPLTDAPTHELAPTIAADGRIVCQVVDVAAGRSHLATVAAGGALEPLTSGPLDATPAWHPDGHRLAYSRRHLRADGSDDTDLVVVDTARDRPAAVVAELPGTDESGPVWSHDGRWLFATSVVRDVADRPRWSSVIVVDPARPRFVPRMLRDRVGAIVRAGPALAPVRLDELALARAPLYRPALTRALRELDQERAPPGSSSP